MSKEYPMSAGAALLQVRHPSHQSTTSVNIWQHMSQRKTNVLTSDYKYYEINLTTYTSALAYFTFAFR